MGRSSEELKISSRRGDQKTGREREGEEKVVCVVVVGLE